MKKNKLLHCCIAELLKKLGVFLLFISLITYHLSHITPACAAIDWLGKGCASEENVIINGANQKITVATLKGLECIFSQVLSIFARLAGLAVFVMLIIGGWQYLTSGGDKQAAQKARNTITYAILGLVLLIGSWFILRFIKLFTGVEVTNFVVGD